MKITIEQLVQENDNNKELIQFLTENNITNKTINSEFNLIKEYLFSYNLCKKREKLDKCQQLIKGYRYKIILTKNQKIKLVLTDCLHRINSLDKKEVINNFLIRHYSDDLLSLSFKKEFIASSDSSRQAILNYLKLNIKLKNCQGLYLYGDTGAGKTFIFILLSNKMIQKKHTVCFVSWPEFIIEIKKNFKNENYSSSNKLDQLKNCDLLFIDDLGGESISSWSRDELLFTVLNARVMPLKTTFINSVYSLKDLERYYRIQNNSIEEIKVKRLIQRIKKLTIPVKLNPIKIVETKGEL